MKPLRVKVFRLKLHCSAKEVYSFWKTGRFCIRFKQRNPQQEIGVYVDRSAKVAAAALVILALSAALFVCYPFLIRGAIPPPGYAIQAHVLTEEPDAFFPLDNPDSVVSQAISNPEQHVIVNQNQTEIVTLIRTYSTSNIKVNGSFYEIGVAFVDYGPPMYLAVIYPASIAGMVASIFVLVIFGLAKKYPPPGKIKMK